MSDQSPNIVIEMLRENRDQHKKTHSELAELKHHIIALRESVAQLSREDTHIYQLLSDHGSRLDRIEERLTIKD